MSQNKDQNNIHYGSHHCHQQIFTQSRFIIRCINADILDSHNLIRCPCRVAHDTPLLTDDRTCKHIVLFAIVFDKTLQLFLITVLYKMANCFAFICSCLVFQSHRVFRCFLVKNLAVRDFGKPVKYFVLDDLRDLRRFTAEKLLIA